MARLRRCRHECSPCPSPPSTDETPAKPILLAKLQEKLFDILRLKPNPSSCFDTAGGAFGATWNRGSLGAIQLALREKYVESKPNIRESFSSTTY
jgi:hypothetical protein